MAQGKVPGKINGPQRKASKHNIGPYILLLVTFAGPALAASFVMMSESALVEGTSEVTSTFPACSTHERLDQALALGKGNEGLHVNLVPGCRHVVRGDHVAPSEDADDDPSHFVLYPKDGSGPFRLYGPATTLKPLFEHAGHDGETSDSHA